LSISRPLVAPSGTQFEIAYGEQRAIAVEVGGGLRSYGVGAIDILDGYELTERCTGARGQLLIPWPNRLEDGAYEFAGVHQQLPLSEPDNHNAIHGLARWASWTACERDEMRVVLGYRLHPQSGWPHALDLRIEYALGPEGLTVRTTAVNLGEGSCPYGAGAHPYLRLDTATIDSLLLQAPGRRHLLLDDRGIPTGSEVVDGTAFDFLAGRELGTTRLDTGYTDLERDADGLARVRLSRPDGRRSVTLWLDRHHPYLMLFTGDSLPDTARRRRGLGVEPMTCAPNALRSGEGLVTLEAGESFTSTWGISAQVNEHNE
jgi:aldose 1-epimerase